MQAMETEIFGTPTVHSCTRVAPETGATLNKTEDDVAACRNIGPPRTGVRNADGRRVEKDAEAQAIQEIAT